MKIHSTIERDEFIHTNEKSLKSEYNSAVTLLLKWNFTGRNAANTSMFTQ